MRNRRRLNGGFTLIEIMITGVIMAILALAIAEVIAWQAKSNRYSRATQTRDNLVNLLMTAVRTPQKLLPERSHVPVCDQEERARRRSDQPLQGL